MQQESKIRELRKTSMKEVTTSEIFCFPLLYCVWVVYCLWLETTVHC